jgi:hypothetical protein
MNRERLIMLLAGSIVLAAVVTYQVRSRRPARSVAAPENTVVAPAPVPGAAAPPQTLPPFSGQPGISTAKLSIPSEGWGRNPFLTPDEIAKLNELPPAIPIAPPPPPPPAPVLPQYEVTAIIIGDKGAFAIVSPNSRVVRVGDRLGMEIVKQIKGESLVLEHDGKVRELALKPATMEAQPPPKGEQP